jgi:tocopherol cyclase
MVRFTGTTFAGLLPACYLLFIPVRVSMPLAIPILGAVLAAIIGILSTTNHLLSEDRLRQTNILKFQPDKFQGGNKHERYFEGWYYKFVSQPITIQSDHHSDGLAVGNDTSFSMAVVPGIFYSDVATSNESHAFVFVTLNGQQQHYYRFDIDQFTYAAANEEYYIQVGKNRFTKNGVSLDLYPHPSSDDADLILRGNLTFTNPSPWPVSLLKLGAMGSVGWMPGLECTHGILSFDHELSGNLSLTVSVKSGNSGNATSSSSSLDISMDGGRGYTEKDFGRSFPSLWIWIQTNSFRQNPGTSLFVSLARIPTPFFGLEFPGFTAAIWHNGILIPFATWSGAAFDDIRISKEEVYIAMRSARRGRSNYRVEISVDRRNIPEVLLYAPVNFTKMEPFVWEALRATVHLRLFDGNGNVIIDDMGDYGGLEVHGNVQYLVDNLCGKKTANKLICL